MEIYQNYWVAEYYQNDDKVVHCKYLYDQDTNFAKQNDTIFYPYGEESSDKDKGSPWQEDDLSSINTFKISKKEKRRSRYDDALPNPAMFDEVKIRRLESKAKINERQVGVWRATSFLSIGLLLISVTGIAYLFFEKVDVKGKTININVKYYIDE